jgi:diaminopimelate epimerase
MSEFLHFHKYQATGNDFIIMDNRNQSIKNMDEAKIKLLCDRRFGIGADGLMLLENLPNFDFKMVYYNSDGRESSMCGNGGRALVQFAKSLHLIDKECNFLAVDGPHFAKISVDGIALQMIDVHTIEKDHDAYVINTGSPHYVEFVQNVRSMDVYEHGKKIRYSDTYSKVGINVNFVEILGKNQLFVRTYERGVEDETLSCGTGVTASALAYAQQMNLGSGSINIETLGGKLSLDFQKSGDSFNQIFLNGPAQKVFEGNI